MWALAGLKVTTLFCKKLLFLGVKVEMMNKLKRGEIECSITQSVLAKLI